MNLPRTLIGLGAVALLLSTGLSASGQATVEKGVVVGATTLPIPYLTPEQEQATFQIPEGYKLELVLSERDGIAEPVSIAFDANGRMYVAEMRTYMQDIDGTGELTPGGRVSRHESTKADGNFDRHSVFVDKLVLPRSVLTLDDRVVLNETDTDNLTVYRDKNGDGVADEKETLYNGGKRGGNLEHQPSGLIWGLDNCVYQAVNAYRLRITDRGVLKESTPGNGAQWGLAQDNYGKIWFTNAGGEMGPVHYQVPIIYGGFDLPGQSAPDFSAVWPLVGLADVQGGPSRFRPADKTLNHFTATCGQEIVRGDRLPSDLQGDLLFCEPVGRLIRRAKVEDHGGMTYLRNAYDKSEFIRSTDPNFRPVNIMNGPDGCLYIVDMYRGIIQEGNWVREGSYLRGVVKQLGLEKNFGRGRIWRLVHKDFQPGVQPQLMAKPAAELVQYLEHPNGWWRDTAQRLLVLRGDRSIVPALQQLAKSSKTDLGRIHALWTLEGLGAIDLDAVHAALKDEHPQVRIAGIRVYESLYRKGDRNLVEEIRKLSHDSDANVVVQTMLTANLLNWSDVSGLIAGTVATNPATGVKEIGKVLATNNKGIDVRGFAKADVARLRQGEEIFQTLCFACHGFDGHGTPIDGPKLGATMAPPLAGSTLATGHRDAIVDILLKGVVAANGEAPYVALMVPMESNDDAWIAAVGSYVRNSFGNHGSMVTVEDVKRIRAATHERNKPWTRPEIAATLPQALGNAREWKLTSSHNTADLRHMIDGDLSTRWTSSATQSPGMWVCVEFPSPTAIDGIKLATGSSDRDYPRGYTVETSADGTHWSQPIASGRGSVGDTQIDFAAVTTKFLRITQTGKLSGGESGLYWSIHELQVFGASNTALNKK